MTRKELLHHLIHQAHTNGFAFRNWFRTSTATPWTNAEAAIEWLCEGARAHILIFSHTFAQAFFRSGERLRYIQPQVTYQHVGRDGTIKTVQRKAHRRRANRDDTWLYHMGQMASAPEPLRYIRRFLLLQETLTDPEALTDPPPPPTEPEPDYDEELIVRVEPQPPPIKPTLGTTPPPPRKPTR